MRRFRPAIVTLLAGCAAATEPAGAPFPAADPLFAADSAFARASAERGAEAWADVWAEDGRMYGGSDEAAVGPEQVRAAIAPTLQRYGSRFRWRPTSAGMLWPDSLGYTVGLWWIEPERAGAAAPDTSRYLTVWRRTDDGWKVALDLSLARAGASAVHAFDFWLGDWSVEQSVRSGPGEGWERYAARDRVRAVEGGGALVESFEGEVRWFWTGMAEPAPLRGASVRVVDADGRWRIFWIDTFTGAFGEPFAGRFEDGVGVFTAVPAAAGAPPRRVRFERGDDGSVGWELALAAGSGWEPLWRMVFRRPR